MKKAGPYHKYFFSEADDKYILDNYLSVTNEEMAKHLAVGLTSLRNHMYQVLKIKRCVKLASWSKEQVNYLFENFRSKSDAEISQYLNDNIPRADGRLINRGMVRKKRELLNLIRTDQEVTALYQTDFLQKKMRTIEQNSASRNQHRNWIAVSITRGQPELRKQIMENPDKYKDLIDLRRLQIQLNRELKKARK